MVKLESVSKMFGDFLAVNNLSLDVAEGEFLTLLGPSGCGKTTTLRLIAGFEQPTSGRVHIGNTLVNDVPPFRRDVNTVFQNYALFPHLTVYENVAFGLRLKKASRATIEERVRWALDLVKLGSLGARRPRQLSGGQQQRVALARALVCHPKVLLLDEPLGALDLKMRKTMQIELKALQRQLGVTFIYVTHDQEEALAMSDRIAVMDAGIVHQLDTAAVIYEYPRTRFVADFIGEANLLQARVAEITPQTAWLEVHGQRLPCAPCEGVRPNQEVWLMLRPEYIRVRSAQHARQAVATESAAVVSGVLREIVYLGATLKAIVEIGKGLSITAARLSSSSVATIAPGSTVQLHWPSSAGHILTQ
ncbi:MAG: ABC transporter ATP-binding protein [Limnochordia bacterium]|jgi:spermidine/putrescine transport system ATP-binding protein